MLTPLPAILGVELSAVSYREKAVSAVGGCCALALLVWAAHQAVGANGGTAVIASMGASAVLLFAVPHGQLSQPWPLLAGHGVSAVIGVASARYLGSDWLAAGCAVGLSIAAMHQLKCIHPPGGATALTAVTGGDAIRDLGFQFVWWPVLSNALLMLAVAVVFNWPFAWRRYPAGLSVGRAGPPPTADESAKEHENIVSALRALDTFVDITEADMLALARLIAREREARSAARRRPDTGRAPPRAPGD